MRRCFRIEEETPDDDEGRQRDRPRDVCGVLEPGRARQATTATRICHTPTLGDGVTSAITAAVEHDLSSGRSLRTHHAPHGASPGGPYGPLVLKTSFGAGFEPATNDLSGRGSTQLSYPVVERMGIEPMTYDLAVVALPLSYLPAADSISYARGIRHGRAGRTGRATNPYRCETPIIESDWCCCTNSCDGCAPPKYETPMRTRKRKSPGRQAFRGVRVARKVG
jgi:hypothetical protein